MPPPTNYSFVLPSLAGTFKDFQALLSEADLPREGGLRGAGRRDEGGGGGGTA